MAYANLASATKLHRANQIVTDIGSNGLMSFYTGSYPVSPDITPSGILLVSLPLSPVSGVASFAVQSGLVLSGGTGGTDGVYSLTITGGGGTGAAGIFTVVGGVLTTIAINNNGYGYTTPPTFSGFTNAGLTGASAMPVMTGILVFNAISSATAIATGTAGFVRVSTSSSVGVIDLDVGTTNAFSVIVNNTFISSGGVVSCTADVLIEG